ncbi:PAS domain S-box protein [Dyadobacter sp. CY323]|uniref:PAS domain S-box protein n=1 Tax=Dyadobacter sp. CY323 TaxID=2907302 RepID=UPI001F1F7FAD|nr:PAS domain S-box protein [Dyadobacter sp. CY323]MCE6989678.1 PAS domain S-box protein [Dyadobacter sp. CY323]
MNRSLKIVHLENSVGGAITVEQALRKGSFNTEIKVIGTRDQYIHALADYFPDIILSEYTLPDIRYSEALEMLRQSGMQIPFIVVSDAISDEIADELLRIGVDDYITKEQSGRLTFAVLRSIEKYQVKREQKDLLEQLTNSEKRFRTLVESSTEAVVVLSAEAQPTYVSPAVKNVLGYTQEEVIGMDIGSITHPEDIPELSKIMMKVLASPGVPIQGHTGRMLHKDGTWRWIEATVTNFLHEPAINGIVDNFRDVTHKKASDEKILHLNRLYAFLSQVNHTLVHATNAQTVFSEVCRIACETGKFQAVWIGLNNPGSHKINVVEARGLTQQDLAGFVDADEEQRALCGFLKSQPYYVSNNTDQSFVSENWKTLAAGAGYCSCMVLPIRRSGNIVGSFNLYAAEIDFFTEAETALLVEAANGISFALDFFEKERLKLVADEQLKHKEQRLSQAQAIAHLGSWESDLTTDTSIWSDEACRIVGLSENDNIQNLESWLSIIHPDDMEYVMKTNAAVLESMQPTDYYHRIVRKDGQTRYLHVHAHIEQNSEGKAVRLYGVLHDVTEMEKSQQALRSSESNLRAIFENTSEGFVLADTNAVVQYFNSKASYFYKRSTGKEIELGGSLYHAVSEYKTEDYKMAITRVLAGETKQYEHVYERVEGEKKWLSVTFTPVYENRQITGLSLTMMDITDRKLAQELLQKSESNLNAIMNNTDALIYSLDSDFKYITYNEALRNMMKTRYGVDVQPGYDIRESISKFDPDSGEDWEQINARAFGGEILKFEKELPYNGSQSHLKFSIHPIRESNTVTGLSCFVNDITKEKRAEEKVVKALEEKNVILESIGDAFYAVDHNWIVTYWNKEAEAVLGCPKEKILGKSVWEVFPDVVGTLFHESYKKAFDQNTIQHFESYYERDRTWFEVTAYPSASGLSIYLRDITRRKNSEAQLNELNENLQNYTNELIASNKGLEQFSYIVSHNLRAPVANIIGLAELVNQDDYPAQIKEEFLKGILLNVKRLDDVVLDLNTILQIKRDVSEKRERVSMQQLVDNIRSSIQNIIEKEHVEIKTDFSAINELFTLKSYLHSVFYNLIMNSIKYRQPDVDPVICMTSSRELGKIVISVRDNGMGIDLMKKGSELFGLYKRFHHHVEGKGMGLFMVRTQVEMLGGKIDVNSAVNKGTEFRIEFRSDDHSIPIL